MKILNQKISTYLERVKGETVDSIPPELTVIFYLMDFVVTAYIEDGKPVLPNEGSWRPKTPLLKEIVRLLTSKDLKNLTISWYELEMNREEFMDTELKNFKYVILDIINHTDYSI